MIDRLSRVLSYPFEPALHAARHYSSAKFRKDIIAGLTVSVVELPQAMAYAIIAGVPPEYGIYASVLQGILGALLSSSEHLTTGPTNTQSLLIAAALGPAVFGQPLDGETYLQLAFALTILKGAFQLAFWAGRFGQLVQLISRSVIIGIASGAGLLIVTGQLAAFLGIAKTPATSLIGVPADIARIWPNLEAVNLYAVAIGVGTVALVVTARRINRFIPGALIAIILASLLVAMGGWSDKVDAVGELHAKLPSFNAPPLGWETFRSLASGALALAILGGIESVAIAKSIGGRSGERIDSNREFFAQGVKNAVTGFFQCIPGSASFTRSALDYDAGAATRFAAVMNGLFVALLFFALAPLAKFIPYAALAGVLFVVAWGLMEPRYFARVWKADRSDAVVFAATFLATILLPLQYAVFIGIGLNIAFFLHTSSRLHITEMVPTETGGFIERPLYDKAGQKRIVFLQVDGDLFFAIAEKLQDQLQEIMRGSARVVVLRLKRCHSIDATVLHVLESTAKDLAMRDGQLILCGVREEVLRGIRAYGLDQTIGAENLFASDSDIFASSRRALRRAEKLAREQSQSSIDTAGYTLTEAGEIMYHI
jgi:sulfate permease, SulP family